MERVVFTGKKGEGLGDSSPRFLTLTRSSKEAFFASFAKNALRAAFVGVVSVFWKRLPHLARGLLENDASRYGCGLDKSRPV
ncbi:MAG: hypothetical protein HQL86_02640 [Magnetococcales bacterium]|nr:hypothetical protein [Magnetococcales bacterium]